MTNHVKIYLLAAFLGGGLGGALVQYAAQPAARAQTGRPAAARLSSAKAPAFTPEERNNIAVYERTNRSVVNITTSAAAKDSFFFFEPPSRGAGSGSLLDQRGHVLTNYHVIEEADEIVVTLYDGTHAKARVVGIDPLNDIAVLRIEAPAELLHPVELGDSSDLKVGQRVYAIGNPFGWERTMSTGIISSLNRSLPSRQHRTIKSMIQIDAALNKGNSGGPLFDSRGSLIGMNTAIASQSGDSAGIGFAIPVNTLNRVIPQLIEKGHVVRPSIGIAAVAELNDRLIVAKVTPGGAAERAGLRGYRLVTRTVRRGQYLLTERRWDRDSADQIVAVDGQRVRTLDQFLTAVEKKRAGQEVRLTIIRDEGQLDIDVPLDKSD